MGFFDDVFSDVFGGVDTSAQDAAAAQNLASQQAISQGTSQARQDILSAFPRADVSRNLGFQGALDILGQSIPQQLQAFQAGNVGAQGQVSAGLPQFQAAILGQPTDFSAFQPSTIPFDAGFAQQTLPFNLSGQGPASAAQSNPNVQALINALGGQGAGGQQFASLPPNIRERQDVSTPPVAGGGGADFDIGSLDAATLDQLQKFGSLLGFAGPVGSLANFGLGQFARVAANEAFPNQEAIGFFEDIFNPDILGGSPLEIQQQREVASRPAARAADVKRAKSRAQQVKRDVSRANREGRSGRGTQQGRAQERSRNIGGRAR